MRFSALQRAENSSIGDAVGDGDAVGEFQCSSASRKFLNRWVVQFPFYCVAFQCSSASRKFLNSRSRASRASASAVSVLFSEPKIPQSSDSTTFTRTPPVSVLFSEPKIPQFRRINEHIVAVNRFSALQRAENSSITQQQRTSTPAAPFQCSSASRKFLNSRCSRSVFASSRVSVLFSEPKIPQSTPTASI